jgi:hypothetical protein
MGKLATAATGDRLVGEIKSVEKDVLTLETGYSDSDFKTSGTKSRRLKVIGNSWWRRSTEGVYRAH